MCMYFYLTWNDEGELATPSPFPSLFRCLRVSSLSRKDGLTSLAVV